MSSKSLSNKTDLHVFHFRGSSPLGGDKDAAFTGREIVDWVERFKIFDRFVLGNHPPTFFRIRTKLSPSEYLDSISSLVGDLRQRFSGRIYKGIEGDFTIKKKGKIGFHPGEKLLARYNPDVSLISFHFHKTLTYANRYEVALSNLVTACRWAIDSGMFHALAHPFDVLSRIYCEDRGSFEEIASLARDKKVAFEINADKWFGEEEMKALIKNDNLFSFGGDFHSLSYWLKRDDKGLLVGDEDKEPMRRLLGLTAEGSDKEKQYWRVLDPLFWQLPLRSEEKRSLRNYAAHLYKYCYPKKETFENGLERIITKFEGEKRKLVEEYLCDLHRIYVKWGGLPRKELRMHLEKYFLEAPLTRNEIGVYERWLAKAFDLGLKREQLINSWETPKLESFLLR